MQGLVYTAFQRGAVGVSCDDTVWHQKMTRMIAEEEVVVEEEEEGTTENNEDKDATESEVGELKRERVDLVFSPNLNRVLKS